MSENAELWSYPDEKSERIALISWLKSHRINYSNDMTNEELCQLYRNVECGKYDL